MLCRTVGCQATTTDDKVKTLQLSRNLFQANIRFKMESEPVNIRPVLPQELWVKIFKYLSQMELLKVSTVCKEFYAHAMDPILWKSLELELGRYNLVAQQALLQRCTRLLHLKFVASSMGNGIEGMTENAMDTLVSILIDKCKHLRAVEIINYPFIGQPHISQLINSSNCTVTQTTDYILNPSGERGIPDTYNTKDMEFHQVGTTDYYRKGKPYKIMRNPGSSIISFNFNTSIERLSSVTISLNHCRTTGDGVVCLTVNGRPAEQKQNGGFGKMVIMAPRFNFGWESFDVPMDLLQDGINKITLLLDSTSPGVYWLSDVKIQKVFS